MLSIRINGTPYTNFISATVTASVTAVARGFSFVSTASADNNFSVKVGDQVTITADGTQIVDGFIESLEINYNDIMHDIRVSGRSFLADFVDSSVPTEFEKTGGTLQSITEQLLSAIGIEATIENKAGSIKTFGNDITSAEIGQNALEFLESYSRKRQVLLTSDGATKMIFARVGTERAPANLKNVRGASDNNILDSTRSINFANRFYRYIVKSQLNTATNDFDLTPEETTDQEGQAIDEQIRSSRRMEMTAEESCDSFSAAERATWERNIRIGNASTYSATVVGNSVDGELWLPNTLIEVDDEFCQIKSTLLIKDVEYNFDLNGGSRTRLTMVTENSLSLEVEQTARKANVKKESDNFLSELGLKI